MAKKPSFANMLHDHPNNAEMMRLYRKALESYFPLARKNLNIIDQSFRGGNVWAVSLFRNIRPDKMINFADLSLMIETYPSYFKDFCIHSGSVVLRSIKDSNPQNDYIARNLAHRLEIRNLKTPVVIENLCVEEHQDSDYGLIFIPTRKTKVTPASQLSYLNDGRSFSKTDENGFPIFDDSGERKFYARKEGISELCFGREGGFLSDGEDLYDFSESSRIVLLN